MRKKGACRGVRCVGMWKQGNEIGQKQYAESRVGK